MKNMLLVVNAAGIQLYCFVMENSIVQIIIVLLFPNLFTAIKQHNCLEHRHIFLPDSILSTNQHRNYLNSNGI